MTRLVFLIFLTTYFSSFAQKPLLITGKFTNLPSSRLILSQHFAGRLVPIDTTVSTPDGNFIFEEKKPVMAGQFRITGLPRPLEILISESFNFSIEADARDVVGTARLVNSDENAFLFQYQREIRKRYQPLLQYRQQARITDDNDPRWKPRYEIFNQGVKDFTDSLYKVYPQRFVTHFLKSFQEPKMPLLPVQKLSAQDSAYLKIYVWQNYFENSFLSDERMVFTSSVPARLERFVKNVPNISSQQLIQTVEKIIAQTNGAVEMRKYMISSIAAAFEATSDPRFDEVYAGIVKKYVEADTALWDASTLQKVLEISQVKQKVAIGNPFPSMVLTDLNDNRRAVEDIKAPNTLLFFYDPGCVHCREATPKLVEFARRNPQFTVYAVSLDNNETTWKQFIKDFKTHDFINVRDKEGKTAFHSIGVWNYPAIFLLDSDKKIVARWLSVEQLPNYLKR